MFPLTLISSFPLSIVVKVGSKLSVYLLSKCMELSLTKFHSEKPISCFVQEDKKIINIKKNNILFIKIHDFKF
jgi:hypothetical protein